MMQGGGRRAGKIAAVVAVVVGATALLSAGPAAAQDDDGLRVETDTVYRVLPDEFAIEVEITYSVTNQVPNRREGFTIIQTFFRAVTELLPAAATDVTATRSNGAALSVELSDVEDPDFLDEDGEPIFQIWEIDLGPNLFYNQTRDFTLRYRIPDAQPRDLDAWARINPAFVSFVALARGDDGLVSVTVEIPESFDVELYSGDIKPRQTIEGGMQIWTIDELDDPYDWSVFFVGSDHQGLDRTPFDVDGVGSFTLAAWPGDDDWSTWAKQTVEEGATFLEDAIGQEWPHDGPMLVMETVIPELAGYAGVYYEPDDPLEPRFLGIDAVVEIGEDLTTEVLNHELAHAWFNSDFSEMRWLNEGLAEYFGQLATDAAGVEDTHRFPTVRSSDRGAFLIGDWRPDYGQNGEERELFGYAASFRVISELAEASGEDGLVASIDVLMDRRNPYDTELEREGDLSWRRVFDTFEVVGGADEAEAIFIEWIVGERHEEEFAERRAAIEYRDDVAAHEVGWDLPAAIPVLLGGWDFEEATALLDDMVFLLDGQVEALAYAEVVGVELPDEVRPAFEQLDDPEHGIGTAEMAAAEQRSAMVRLHAAQVRLAQPRSFVEGIGLRGHDPDADLAAAIEAFEAGDYDDAVEHAAAAVDLVDSAGGRGSDQLTEWALYAAAVLFGLVAALWLWRRRRRKQRESAANEAGSADTDLDAGSPVDDGVADRGGEPGGDDEGVVEVE